MPEHGDLHVLPPYSVVIPCYNHGEFLDEAVDSALNQTHPPAEIIVVDDGSTDTQTLQVFGNLKARGITVLHKQNGHLSSARNYGIGTAAHAFILVLDADDRFHPAFAEKALPLLESDPVFGTITPGYRLFGAASGEYYPTGGSACDFLVINNSCGNVMLRKSAWLAIGGYDENMKSGFEDWEFSIRLTKSGWRVGAIAEVLFDYRIKQESMYTLARSKGPEIFDYILKKHADVYLENAIDVIAALYRINAESVVNCERNRLEKIAAINAFYNDPMNGFRILFNSVRKRLFVS